MVFGRKKDPPQPSIMISPPQGNYGNMPEEINNPFPGFQQPQQEPTQQQRPQPQRSSPQQPKLVPQAQQPEPVYEPEIEPEPQAGLPQRKLSNKQARIIRTEVTDGGYFVSVVEHNYPLGIGWCELEQ